MNNMTPNHSNAKEVAVSLPLQTQFVEILGVSYAHCKTSDGGELYLTRHGVPFWEHLLPESWFEKKWFEEKRERLSGTSVVYRVPTRTIRNISLDLVVKWSRVGEDVPVDTFTINQFVNSEFNSPFEEFSVLKELREGKHGPPGLRILTQKPLAIYVPPEKLQLWQTGRSESKIAAKLARHPGVELDILRQYVLLYGWIKGADLVEVSRLWNITQQERIMFLDRNMRMVIHELEVMGFRVLDMKPTHIIVRVKSNGALKRDRDGKILYGLVDYELLERTPEHEQTIRSRSRKHYHQHMAKRFESVESKPMPPHLKAVNILGVDYIFGHAESTQGLLWVVGKDPDLFNYFLPERWRRTPREALSDHNQVYLTHTKDDIRLVWRVSRVGDPPFHDYDEAGLKTSQSYNSPFEEFACALALSRAGMKTIYPRAIYMTGYKATHAASQDHYRYDQLQYLHTPEGLPILCDDHEYITIWGFFNGPDEELAVNDGRFWKCLNAEEALHSGVLRSKIAQGIVSAAYTRMLEMGFYDPHPKPDHLLVTIQPDGQMAMNPDGLPDYRICNFELVRKLPSSS